ncbi:4-hydroxy-tetrahydrodipicolinate synthase [Bordetella sp. N]|uniref:4-hydroxy-tetrahydrodipicolinate synthase n=1 Tax=Bordetella sp. N TaxID=1746199 RepID=UPI00070EBB82|nr:4-hydroxy-tetrahydrodipicolinate synthase [Bordetella sp. N]ALM85307.1 4-hydroxy-tetrahydrodipicolinate synthase [Bordetella sp. N]
MFYAPPQDPFHGIWVPLITPFAGDRVDHPALRRLVRHYRRAGVHGLIACGTTAEAAALDAAEQGEVLDTVLAEAGGMPVVMGLAGNNLRQVQARAREWGARPIAGLLATAPYYIRPSQAGLLEWFGGLADAAPVPLVIYDIPYRTGATLELATLLRLAAHPNIVAIKDCGGSLDKTIALIADGRLAVMAGEDLQAMTTLCLGGRGVIAASAHVRPDLYVALYDAVAGARIEQARALFHALAPVIRLLYAEPNPGPVKALLGRLHGFDGAVRAPLVAPDATLLLQLEAAVAALAPVDAEASLAIA